MKKQHLKVSRSDGNFGFNSNPSKFNRRSQEEFEMGPASSIHSKRKERSSQQNMNNVVSAANLKSGMSTRIISNDELPGVHSNGMFGSVEDLPELGMADFDDPKGRETFQFELKDKPSKIEGILYAVASQISWSLMLPILKLLYKHNPSVMSSEALYFKSISMVFFICIYSNWSTGTFSLSVPKQYRTLIFVRCFTGFIWISTQFISIQYLSIGTATCIIYTSPIITTFLAFFFMNEFISGWDVFALLASFGGVLIINNGAE